MKRLALALLFAAAPAAADQSVPQEPTPGASVDMDAWESQVLGSIFGVYCGYYPDRTTIQGRLAGFTSYKACAAAFADVGPACAAEVKAKGGWRVTTSAEGTVLGAQIGACIDGKLAQRRAKLAPK